ncbi:MAG: hypothetical protein IDH49_01515 [Gammaproteobacteria bacterium]|nr:hypothetical protein [Gammaproteobacteria bacterium]
MGASKVVSTILVTIVSVSALTGCATRPKKYQGMNYQGMDLAKFVSQMEGQDTPKLAEKYMATHAKSFSVDGARERQSPYMSIDRDIAIESFMQWCRQNGGEPRSPWGSMISMPEDFAMASDTWHHIKLDSARLEGARRGDYNYREVVACGLVHKGVSQPLAGMIAYSSSGRGYESNQDVLYFDGPAIKRFTAFYLEEQKKIDAARAAEVARAVEEAVEERDRKARIKLERDRSIRSSLRVGDVVGMVVEEGPPRMLINVLVVEVKFPLALVQKKMLDGSAQVEWVPIDTIEAPM